jgi:myo-inositol-1(or 4)-monophosphatase
MVSLGGCRAVDAAAAQYVVRQAGGVVRFEGAGGPLDFQLADFDARAAMVAAATAEGADGAERIIRG